MNRLVVLALLQLSIPCFASTVSTFDVLVATGSFTATSTATIKGSEFSVASATFNVINGRVGIGTTTPVAQFQVLGPRISGTGTQIVWSSTNAALRAGETSSNLSWTETSLPDLSVGFGWEPDASAAYTTVSGGYQNSATVSAAAVGGGSYNIAQSNEAVAAGYGNNATGIRSGALSGTLNVAAGQDATVSGGYFNIANGNYSVIPGGYFNAAGGDYSFAAGYQSSATHQGSFVWSDSTPGTFTSGTQNEFRVRAAGGFVFYGGSSTATVIVANNSIVISTSNLAATAVPNIFVSSVTGGVGIGTKSLGSGGFSLTTSSGIHVLAGGVTWADGTVSTSAASLSPIASSCTIIPRGGTFTSTTLGSGSIQSGSTVTLATSGNPVMATFNGDLLNGTDSTSLIAIVVDGTLPSQFATNRGILKLRTSANLVSPASFSYIASVSAGSHTFSVTRATTEGTATFCDTSIGGMSSSCQFCVTELK